MSTEKRYAQVGVGSRSLMYSRALVELYDHCTLVAICDVNEGRLKQRAQWAADRGTKVTMYHADDFDRMIHKARPDTVIVTTPDCYHDHYICRAMELGCDVITEKPLTTDAQKCQRIIDTQQSTGKTCRVTFNYRYSPPRTQIKDLLMSGIIGEVLSLDFHWMLDTHHGADYFRRWHRNKSVSGGLMVHKATHHFDLVNWWLSTVPETVFAEGRRAFYLPRTAQRYGLDQRAERCLDCPEKERCPYYLDLTGNPKLKALYVDNEEYDGYYRDRCVFSSQINIEDSMQLAVRYRNGAGMSYSLNAFMPWEGYTVTFNGSKGRLEHRCEETVYVSGDGTTPGELMSEGTTIKIYPHFDNPYAVPVWQGEGGHGGGDRLLLEDLFGTQPKEDKYMRAADHRAGAYSILTGVAANQSIQSGNPVRIDELVHDLRLPAYPAMPSPETDLPLASSSSQRIHPDEESQS